MPRYYVQQSDGAASWMMATAPSRHGAQSQSRSLQKVGNSHGRGKRYVRAMSRSALLREGGVDACIWDDDPEGLELEGPRRWTTP